MAKTVEELQAELTQAQAEIASRDQQMRGLSSERDQYRQNWQRVREEAGEVVQVDANGNFVGFDTTDVPAAPVAYSGGHPLTGLIDDPKQVDAYYQSLYTQQLNAAGYVTTEQAKQLAMDAYQLARGDGQVWRMHDKLTAKADYADLAKADSDLTKRTATILQERNLGRPLQNAKGFDEWQYGDLGHLQFAADLARLQMHEEAQRAGTVVGAAQQAQNQAGLSVGSVGNVIPAAAGEVPTSTGGAVDWDKVRADTDSRAQQFGVKV